MKGKRIKSLCMLFVLVMIASPITTITAICQTTSTASTSSIENLIIRDCDDESVVSIHPTSNYAINEFGGGLFVGSDGDGGYSRSWLKFDLASIPKEIGILNVRMFVYCNSEWNTTDLPFGIFYSSDNNWSENSITWNNQPDYNTTLIDYIDSPASPDMFVPGNWYSFDVSNQFISALMSDKLLSVVLRQLDEESILNTWTYFAEKDFDFLLAPYLSVEYTTPDTAEPKVDGHITAPLINYIQDSTPDLSWTMADSVTGEYQRDYAVEVNSNQYFNGTSLWSESHTDMVTIYDSAGAGNTRPFAIRGENRYQMKFDQSLLSNSGIIDKLYFEAVSNTGILIFENLVVLLASTNKTGDLTSDFAANYGAAKPVVVLNRSSYGTPIIDNYFAIDIENTFFLSERNSLIIELRFTDNIGTLTSTPITLGVGGSVAYSYGLGAYTSATADFLYDRAHSLKVEMESTTANPVSGLFNNHFPFGTDNGYSGKIQLKYNKSLISNTGVIDRIYFSVGQFSGDVVYEGFRVHLVETPLLGRLDGTNLIDNYGGVTPTLVLDAAVYSVRNVGGVLVIDIDNTFYYDGQQDLLVEISWDNKICGDCYVYDATDYGCYRAYDVTWNTHCTGNDTAGYDMTLDFVHSESTVEYAGVPLINTTTYYWRVKTCDSTGIWSDWTNSSFRYEKLESGPEYTTPIINPSPVYMESPVSFSLDVTYFLGIQGVWIEIDGANYSMVAEGDTYNYTWIPTTAGNFTYTIYMESNIHTWSSVSDTLSVKSAITTNGSSFDPTMLLIIVGIVAAIAIVVVVITVKNRGAK